MKSSTVNYFVLAGVFLLYSLAVLSGKFASEFTPFSFEFILFYLGQLLALCVYAVLWQFTLKKNKLTVAYSMKSLTIIYGVIWGTIFFNETISLIQLVGIAVIIIGVVMVATHE